MFQKEILNLIDTSDAIIFDMDGVIAQTEPLKGLAYTSVFLHNFDITLPKNDTSWRGKSEKEVIQYWFKKFNITDYITNDINKLIKMKRSMYKDLLNSDALKSVPGVIEFIKLLRQKNKMIGLATGSNKEEQKRIFELLSLNNAFDNILTNTDVSQPKPNPEIYLRMAQLLQTTPDKCLVFEDSPSGVKSCQSAQMNVIGVLTSYSPEHLKNCSFYIKNFNELLKTLKIS
jgi:beta-phosphoglucomutase